MNSYKTIEKIVHIPRDFYSQNNVSIYTLIKDSGYIEKHHNDVFVEDIREILALDPKCIDEWLIYSENKRCDYGWYFNRTEKHKYVVGYHPSDTKSNVVTYDDPLNACTDFIKKEIEDIRRRGKFA